MVRSENYELELTKANDSRSDLRIMKCQVATHDDIFELLITLAPPLHGVPIAICKTNEKILTPPSYPLSARCGNSYPLFLPPPQPLEKFLPPGVKQDSLLYPP